MGVYDGPLTIRGKLTGVASWADQYCGINDYPGVYTEVAYYRQWIDKRVQN